MAHFRGTVSGGRTQASRLGHKSTGLETTAASWQGAAHVRLWHDASSDTDMVEVALTQHHGAGVSPDVVLYRGPVGEYTAACRCRHSRTGFPAKLEAVTS